MKIYTKTGDSGTTGLFAGPRVPKDHPRIAAYGAVDELNAVLGLFASSLAPGLDWQILVDETALSIRSLAEQIQSDLFSIGAELATPDPRQHGMCLLPEQRVPFLEGCIDSLEAELPPLSHFVLPGGTSLSAQLHLARTVCRRAEREVVHLAHQPEAADCDLIIVYLNRLSDLLFVAARWVNHRAGVADVPWHRPAAARG
jgi:cob(I)alamin adenosyltransferase